MKVKMVVGLLIFLLMLGGTHLLQVNARPAAPSGFLYESGAFAVNGGEFALAKLINVDTVSHNYRVVIYRAIGMTLPVVLDTGVQSIASGTLVYAIAPVEPGALDDYSVEITTDSDKIIPVVAAQTPGCDPTCHIPRVELHGSQLTSFKQAF
jgi:hypothetical protein